MIAYTILSIVPEVQQKPETKSTTLCDGGIVEGLGFFQKSQNLLLKLVDASPAFCFVYFIFIGLIDYIFIGCCNTRITVQLVV